MSDQKPTDIEIWEHFNTKPSFKATSDGWADNRELFCRLVRAVHNAGLDWWHIDAKKGSQVRFGRKEKGAIDAKAVLFRVRSGPQIGIQIQPSGWLRKLGSSPFTKLIDEAKSKPLDEQLISQFEQVLEPQKMHFEKSLLPKNGRSTGYWPDDLGIGTNSAATTENQAAEFDDGDMDEDTSEENQTNDSTVKITRNKSINRIYYGPPGTGKTHKLNPLLRQVYGKLEGSEPEPEDDNSNKRYAFVTFHQSYGYEEFVEGLRPILENEGKGTGDKPSSETLTQKGDVQYEIRSGVFKDLCDRARKDPNNQYAMVIDEINRGNISKIFGELITLIEDDKREGTDNTISVTLPYSGKPFSVPANVDIIGTMNTADRSLALLDTALRRRFEFEPMLPKPELLAEIKIESNGKTIEVQKLLAKMNERIELLYDRDHCIGHAYFFPLKEDNSLEKLGTIFQKQILPLLEEYFFEDWEKIRLVLGDKQKAKEHQFITETKTDNDALIKLFGSGHGLDAESQPARYAINADAFGKVESYLGIYQASKQAAKENQAETSADNTNGE